MQIIYKVFALALLLGVLSPLNSQNQEPAPCGTRIGVSPWLRDFQNRIHSSSRTDDVLYLPLQVHMVGTDQGTGYMSTKAVFQAFCTLNEDFAQANIQFFLANPINYIDNSGYYQHEFDGGYDMMAQNNFPNVINCYIVEDPAGNCGYFFPGVDGIALAKGCTGPNDHTWAHEVGHFLSLPHPFYGWEGETHNYSSPAPLSWEGWQVEKVDGSNCTNAGDGFCDTAPDYLNYRWNCNADGFSSTVQTDPNGATFVSDGTLYMSYSNAACKSTFSDDQIAAMRANIEEVRTNLITLPPAVEDITISAQDEINLLVPASGVLAEGDPVTLTWEAIPGATHYIVQVNPFNFFSIIFEEQIVEGPSIQISGLQPNRTHYWRIKPFNWYNTCSDFTSSSSFETGITTATQERLPGESFQISPNPSSTGQVSLRIQTTTNTLANWQLIDSRGSLQQTGSFQTSTGTQEQVLDISGLPAGLYFIQLQLDGRQSVHKLMVN
ncbi:T9SS type A sorting domain-containing protein [Lewinella sp. LCG006]|uniref:T9SS type A sorting domain-containing protein n=1 Tax=Lewinella sp. LCG006 TaxID=3231911 RepID=UPI003460FCD9